MIPATRRRIMNREMTRVATSPASIPLPNRTTMTHLAISCSKRRGALIDHSERGGFMPTYVTLDSLLTTV